jgi:hypothetical protein
MRANVKPGLRGAGHEKSPAGCAGLLSCSDVLSTYRPVPVPVPSMVDPLGDGLTSVLPEGLVVAAFGLPIAPGLDWPVVAPGEVMPPLGDGLPDTPPDVPPVPAAPPEAPPAPAACAIANELESASVPASAIVANFMGYSLTVMRGNNPRGAADVPSPLDEHSV